MRGQFSLFKGSVESGPVDVRVGRGRPVVASALVELKRRKPMGGSESGCEVVGDDGGIGYA